MIKRNVISLDGGMATGTSSVSKLLAAELGCKKIPTSHFYRALGFTFATETGSEPSISEPQRTLDFLSSREDEFQLTTGGLLYRGALIDGIESAENGTRASVVAKIGRVRETADGKTLECARQEGGLVVSEGRDDFNVFGELVLAGFYFHASIDERVPRVLNDPDRNPNGTMTYFEAYDLISARDRDDTIREHGSMRPQPNAH
jgi:cytidylate kinase